MPSLGAVLTPRASLWRRSKLWEALAAAQFCADGVTEGWDSDDSDAETPEQKYMKVHIDMLLHGVIERMAACTTFEDRAVACCAMAALPTPPRIRLQGVIGSFRGRCDS